MLLPHSSSSKGLWGQGEGPSWDVIQGGSQLALPCQSSHAFPVPCRDPGCAVDPLCASPCLARAGTMSLGQATALASACEVGAHLGQCQSCP